MSIVNVKREQENLHAISGSRFTANHFLLEYVPLCKGEQKGVMIKSITFFTKPLYSALKSKILVQNFSPFKGELKQKIINRYGE